jgi:hypothetical protein
VSRQTAAKPTLYFVGRLSVKRRVLSVRKTVVKQLEPVGILAVHAATVQHVLAFTIGKYKKVGVPAKHP